MKDEKDNKGTEDIFDPLEHAVALTARKHDDEFCPDALALPEDGFRAADGASVDLFLCALCGAQYICGGAQRQVG